MRKKLTYFEKFFTQGYICACATMLNQHGEDTIVRDCLKGCETDIPKLRRMGVEESDIETLRPILNDINKQTQSPHSRQ